ncbi:FAD/NAD(P)-binding domain-containing protein [Corynespora cassiicola Philippines]|uniref:FAD/NAD(P)-binding domain-containing protein n=1 Tax=Corynespora cassiicola Philippines TaxID=1448308 RepID=A0A2T2NZF8_CORCC|nr:FAD/NAD(P)-binding domain-containing protein [Corynespora cassiicola Philippines]
MSNPLDIVIVGAGLSGLAASIQSALSGHRITILEAARELAEKWGVYDTLRGPVEPQTCTVYNYKGKVLAYEDKFDKKIRQKYGAPFSDCHRVDLQRGLVKRAEELGVKVVLGARVVNMDTNVAPEDTPDSTASPTLKLARVTLENGTSYMADLIIGADGLWSTTLAHLTTPPTPTASPPLPTGDLAYRITLPIHQIPLSKPHLRNLIANPSLRFWIGPASHVVAYSMRGGNIYNVVLLVPDDLDAGTRRTAGSVAEMRALFRGWDPLLTEILECVDGVDKWKLMHRDELPSWIGDRDNLVLIGDACHPMLPYLAQGANSSIEDGAVLGALLARDRLGGKDGLPGALRVFQRLRKERGERIVRETFKQRRDFHMEDGEEQERRDRVFEKWLGKERIEEPFPSRWTCPEVQGWLYGYDAFAEVERVAGAD